jgi:hypothetical protein
MIEQKKKLRLEELQVDSFVTTDQLNNAATIKGGFNSYFSDCYSRVLRNGERVCDPEIPL